MKNLVILLIILVTIGSCNSRKQTSIKSIKMSPHDTIIRFSENRQMYYTGYKEVVDSVFLYTERYLLDNKRDTISQSYGYSECWYKLSPNKQFVIIDAIDIGYVDVSETETVLRDRWTCGLIRLNDGEIINTYQSDCDGEWNSKNQWLSGDEIIFDPERDLE